MEAAVAYLRERRVLTKQTQKTIARKVGVKSETVSRWERNEQPPEMDNLFAYLDAVEGSVQDLVKLLRDTKARALDGKALALESLRHPGRDLAEFARFLDTEPELAELFRHYSASASVREAIRAFVLGLRARIAPGEAGDAAGEAPPPSRT